MLSKECHEETVFSFSSEAPLPPERRREARHLTILRVGALIAPGGRELCLIRNISAGGLMAHVYSHHREGDSVTVEIKSNHQIPGHILWVEDSNVGIGFDEPIDVEEMLASQGSLENGWRPRPPRVEVDRLGSLRCGARLHAINTRDISQGGVKVEIDHPVESGADVVLMLDKLRPVAGVVRWCQDGQAGIAFNQVIPFHELMTWLRPDPTEAKR
jgi:hypothetical protein